MSIGTRTSLSCLLLASALAARIAAGDAPPPPAAPAPAPAEKKAEPHLGIRFAGFIPGSVDRALEGKFKVEFRIYRSPQGGEPIWREEQEVEVKGGRMDVVLGSRTPIPMAIHEATFKFLGASVSGNREVYPRYAIVNVVYASAKEALEGIVRKKAEPARVDPGAAPPSPAPGKSDPPAAAIPAVYPGRGGAIARETEKASTWAEALRAARAAGGDLPDYEDWYRALEEASPGDVPDRTGHYEWVLPWVYDTASHGEYNTYFRGRFQGCDYMDLSPGNKYPYRLSRTRK